MKSKIVHTFFDPEKNHVVGVDKYGREIWYSSLDKWMYAYRSFDRRGNVVYYKNKEGVEITRKFDRENNLIYSNDCGDILVDKRKTRPIREKIQKWKLQYKYRESLKLKIRYFIFRIKHRKEIKEALKKVGE